jgi:hypothetical protein
VRTPLLIIALIVVGCGGTSIPSMPDAGVVDGGGCPQAPGGAACTPSEYCFLHYAGRLVTPPDAGFHPIDAGPPADAGPSVPGCNSLPSSCAITPTCACLLTHLPPCGGGMSCVDAPTGPRVSCMLP